MLLCTVDPQWKPIHFLLFMCSYHMITEKATLLKMYYSNDQRHFLYLPQFRSYVHNFSDEKSLLLDFKRMWLNSHIQFKWTYIMRFSKDSNNKLLVLLLVTSSVKLLYSEHWNVCINLSSLFSVAML